MLIHPGVSQVGLQKGINKTWAPTHWSELILELSRQHEIILVGGPDDTQTIQQITESLPRQLGLLTNLAGQTQSIAEVLGLMQQADAVVCVDSAPPTSSGSK